MIRNLYHDNKIVLVDIMDDFNVGDVSWKKEDSIRIDSKDRRNNRLPYGVFQHNGNLNDFPQIYCCVNNDAELVPEYWLVNKNKWFTAIIDEMVEESMKEFRNSCNEDSPIHGGNGSFMSNLDTVINSAPESMNALKEMSDWIIKDENCLYSR